MRKAKLLFLLCIFVLLFSSCSSTSSEVQSSSNDFATQVNEVFDTYADYGSQVFIGLSGPYTSHEKGYFEATANAYRMALLYEDLIMRVDVSIDVNTALDRDSFRTYSDALYDEARLIDVASRLEILEAKWIGGDVGAVVVEESIELLYRLGVLDDDAHHGDPCFHSPALLSGAHAPAESGRNKNAAPGKARHRSYKMGNTKRPERFLPRQDPPRRELSVRIIWQFPL